MNIKELYYYHDLVRTKNFSQVAADFNISQPTVTMAIKRLEESFGTTFFMRDRSHHQLTVTSTGLQFDQHVQRIIEELEIAQKELTRAKQERISFGLPPIIGSWYFPRFTPALLQAGLLNRLEVVDHGSASLLQLLAKGELDLALLGSLQPFQQPSLRALIRHRLKLLWLKIILWQPLKMVYHLLKPPSIHLSRLMTNTFMPRLFARLLVWLACVPKSFSKQATCRF